MKSPMSEDREEERVVPTTYYNIQTINDDWIPFEGSGPGHTVSNSWFDWFVIGLLF